MISLCYIVGLLICFLILRFFYLKWLYHQKRLDKQHIGWLIDQHTLKPCFYLWFDTKNTSFFYEAMYNDPKCELIPFPMKTVKNDLKLMLQNKQSVIVKLKK